MRARPCTVTGGLGSTERLGGWGWCEASAQSPSHILRPTTHLRSSSQEVFDCHEGLFAAKARSGACFFLRLSQYCTALEGVQVCQHLERIRIHLHAKALTAAW